MNDKAIALAILEQRTKRNVRLFPEQDAFVFDNAQFITALCTRRAGKSTGLGRRFKEIMDRYPGCLTRYLALTRDSAKDIMWNALQELNEANGWNCRFVESTLTMIAPNESRLRLYGADMKNFIRRLRGAKTAANAIDEAQEFSDSVLTDLVDNILTPSMADYDNSWLALTGTPGPIPRGYFYDATEGGVGGYVTHRWSLYQNPYLPNAQEFVDKLKARKKWTDSNPTFLREYKGLWVLDVDSLLVRYSEQINHFETLPIQKYTAIMGIDIGFNDADAIAILLWSPSDPCTYLVEECITAGQGLTELVEQVQRLAKKWEVSKMVIDEGGLGKKLAEEMRRRHKVPVHAAEKQRKFENVAFLNDALRMGKFKAKKDSRFAEDSLRVQIDQDKTTPDRLVVKKGFHSDIIDAVLYAFVASPAFSYEKPVDKPAYRSREWFEQEEMQMERDTEERLKAEEKAEKGFNDYI